MDGQLHELFQGSPLIATSQFGLKLLAESLTIEQSEGFILPASLSSEGTEGECVICCSAVALVQSDQLLSYLLSTSGVLEHLTELANEGVISWTGQSVSLSYSCGPIQGPAGE